MNKSLKELGETIRTIREDRGLLQKDLAETLNIDGSGVSRIENGITNINYEQLLRISELFGMDVTDILAFNASDKNCIERKFRKPNRIMVELEIGDDEVIKMRLKDHIYQLA